MTDICTGRCAFGQLVSRFCLLQRPLKFSLPNVHVLLQALSRLHNLCTDDRSPILSTAIGEERGAEDVTTTSISMLNGEVGNRAVRSDRDRDVDQTAVRERLADAVFAAGLRHPSSSSLA
jgi:hypothetical protein